MVCMVMARRENGARVVRRWNTVFEALSAEPRRQIIVALLDAPADQPVSLPETAMNPNAPVSAETLRLELRHTHLPMLADTGFVEWEADPFVASRGARFAEVAVVFESLLKSATTLPEGLVTGCQRLERERGEIRE